MTVVQRSPTAGIHGVGGLRWVPVYTGTTAGDGAPHTVGATARPHRHSRDSGRRRTSHRHSREGGNPWRGSLRWVPVYTGTTVGDGAPHTVGRRRAHIVIAATAGIHGGGETGMGSRLHGNDGGRRRTPHGRRQRAHIVIAATAGIHGVGRQGWVPVSTGTTVAPHIVIAATAGIHGVGSLRWVPVSTGTTVAPHMVIPATAGIHGVGSLRWVPVSTGTTVGGGAPHTVGDGAPTSSFPRRRESTCGGSLRWVPVSTGTTVGGGAPHTVGDGAPTSSFPRRRESTCGGSLRWVPVSTGTTVGDGAPHTVGDGAPTSSFPRRRESTAGGACDGVPSTRERRCTSHRHSRDGGNPRRGDGMGSRLHGNDGGRGRTPHGRPPHRHSRESGNPRGGEPAMGSRLHGNDGGRRRTPHGRRRRTHIVIPATAGIHGVGGLRWVPVYTGTTEAPTSSLPRGRRESPAWRGVRVHPRAMGSRDFTGIDGRAESAGDDETAHGFHTVHGNDGGAHIVIPATAGIHGGESLRWVPVSTGTTEAPHMHSREGGNPRRGERACDGLSSRLHGNDGGRRRTPHGRRRRAHIVIPATAGIHGGGSLRWVPVSTGTTVGGGAPHTAGDGAPTSSFPRRRESTAWGAWMGSRLHGNDGSTHIVIAATAGIRGGVSLRWVPVSTGTTVGDGAPHTVGGGAPTSSFPRRRESTAGRACDGFPSPRERR